MKLKVTHPNCGSYILIWGTFCVQVPAADIPDTLPLADNVAHKQPSQAPETVMTEDSEVRLVLRIREKLLKTSKGSDRFAFSQSHPCMQHLKHHLTSCMLKNLKSLYYVEDLSSQVCSKGITEREGFSYI